MKMIFLLIAIFILSFIPMIFMPYWTRKTESFGVSIPEKAYGNSDLTKMRKQYVFIMIMISTVFIGIFVLLDITLSHDENAIAILFSIAIGIYLIANFIVYLYFHRQMEVYKKLQDWEQNKSQLIVVDTQFRNQKLVYSNLWFIIPFSIALLTIVLSLQFYPKFPDRIPMQYDLLGKVTRSAEKSHRTVLLFPIMQVCMTLLFLFVNVIIAKAKQQVSAINPEKSMLQNVIFRRRWSLFIIITGTAFILMFSIIQFSFIYPINPMVLLLTPLLIGMGTIIGAIVLSITTGQGGSRIGKEVDKTGKVVDRDDDQYWKLGQFYYNKNDPTIFLEKRFGVGWTNNWAHPISWIILIAIILIAIGIPILLGA